MTEPNHTVVRREVTVPTTVERAFAVFTERYDEVKPREHTLLAAPIAETVLEPWVGGEIIDRAVDGSECRWGEITAFEPPHRFVFLWKIGPDWTVVDDRAQASEVEVTFMPAASGGTHVVLEHRHLDRHGPGWEKGLRDSLDSDEGWQLYLRRFEAMTPPV